MELLQKLGIDWKLLVAQTINFFILLAVLYKFVYKPVLALLERRSQVIEKGIRDAKESEDKLRKIEQMREEKMAETAKEVGKIFDKVKADAEAVKKDLMANASAQAEDLLRRAKLQITEEKEKMIQDVKREVGTFILQAVGKLLEREFSVTDQKRLAEAITNEMKTTP